MGTIKFDSLFETQGNNKIELIKDDTVEFGARKLTRIKAKEDIPQWGIKQGQKGGYVEYVLNVLEDGWVGYNSYVSGEAVIMGYAGGKSIIHGMVSIRPEAVVRNVNLITNDKSEFEYFIESNANIQGSHDILTYHANEKTFKDFTLEDDITIIMYRNHNNGISININDMVEVKELPSFLMRPREVQDKLCVSQDHFEIIYHIIVQLANKMDFLALYPKEVFQV